MTEALIYKSGNFLASTAKLVWIDGMDFGAAGMASLGLTLIAPLLVLVTGLVSEQFQIFLT